MATWLFGGNPVPAPADEAPAPAAAPKNGKKAPRKDIMNGRLEKRSGDGSWKAHGFYVHSTILCYYLEDQDGVEDAPHASMNLLSVEKVDTKMKDGRKVVRLWIDEKKKVELRQAPKDGDKDDASIDKWEQAFTAFVEQAKTNGARQKYIDDHKPKSRMRRMSESVEMAVFGAPEDPQANLNALAKAGIIEFYKAHNPAKLKDVDGLIEKYKTAGVDVPTLFEAIKKKYEAAGAPS